MAHLDFPRADRRDQQCGCPADVGCASESRATHYDNYDTWADLPLTADGLHRIRALRLGAVYLRPGARFGGYDSVVVGGVHPGA